MQSLYAQTYLQHSAIERLSMSLYGKRERAFHFVIFLLSSEINLSEK